MSLKGIHILFILASIALSIFVGVWSLTSPAMAGGAAANVTAALFFAVAAGMIVYLVYFLRKFRTISSM